MDTKEIIKLLLERLEDGDYVMFHREYDDLRFRISVEAREAQEESGRP